MSSKLASYMLLERRSNFPRKAAVSIIVLAIEFVIVLVIVLVNSGRKVEENK
jgi:predicted PurR-regulated permease PerM